jgi:hypothetical protein
MNVSKNCFEALTNFFNQTDILEFITKPLIINIFFNVVLTLSATLGNGLIILAILRSQNLQTPSYLLVTSLAFTDLLVGLVYHPLQIILSTHVLRYNARGVCEMISGYSFVTTFLCVLSFVMVLFISIDRNFAFSLRHRYRVVVTKKRVRLLIVVGWMLAFPLAFSSTSFSKDKSRPHVLVLMCVLGILLFSTCVFYIKAYRSLLIYASQVHAQQPPNVLQGNLNVVKYRKTFITMLVIFGCFLLCFVPFICSLVAIAYLGITIETLTSAFGSLSLLGLHSSLNPIIYLIRFRDIRQVSQRMLSNLVH